MDLKIKNAAIIAVGDEVLCGDVVNTNAAYVASKLESSGIRCAYQCVIPDGYAPVRQQVDFCKDNFDLIVTIGGLGPTEDDLTKEAVADALGLELKKDEESERLIHEFFKTRSFIETPNNLKQGEIPEGAEPLINNVGTAPGVYLEFGKNIYVLLPGPPGELIPMVDEVLSRKLAPKAEFGYSEKHYLLWGMGESNIEQALRDNIQTSEKYTLNTYAGTGSVRLKATAFAENKTKADALIAEKDKEIKQLFSELLLCEENADICKVAAKLLLEKNITVSSAESCTGGLLASKLTEISGISKVFPGSAVTYCDEVKMKVLGVKKATLDAHTAVSRETAAEMAEGVRNYFGTDVGIGITGYAGPGGGDDGTPVGQVYIGICFKGKTEVIGKIYKGSRNAVRERSVNDAFALLLKYLKDIDI